MNLDTSRFQEDWNDGIKERLGGDWYDNWWCSIFSWLCLHEGGKSEWWSRHYRDDFFKEINSGWIKMYPEPRKEPLSKVELIRSMVNAIRVDY